MNNTSPLRVLYFGTYRDQYNRNQMMIAGMRLNNVEVTECHETLWRGTDDRVEAAAGGWIKPAFLWRALKAYARLLAKYRRCGDYDVMMVAYPGQLDIFLARLLSWLNRKPLVWDVLMSVYLISVERGLDQKSALTTRLLHWVEKIGSKLPEKLITDTPQYREWISKEYRVPLDKFFLVPIGADDRIFHPSNQAMERHAEFRVIYAGTFIRNHGILYIMEAARILAHHRDIHFELVGAGPELENARQFALANNLTNINFVEWMAKDLLISRISQADLCLGTFGTTPQSLITVQNKVYEALAMRMPLVTGDSPAIRQVFTHKLNLYTCQRADGQAIAEAILALRDDPGLREHIATHGYELFCEQFSLKVNGRRCANFLDEIVR